jgi:aryl sulfotransferase
LRGSDVRESTTVPSILWLASYPKSGNTWMRALLANLNSEGEKSFNINAPGQRYGITSSRALFEDQTLLDSSLLTDEEIDDLRPGVYRAWADELARERSAPFVMKCHDAYTRLADGTPLLGGGEAARGAIMLVRDPRDVALSLADYRGTPIDEAIDLMCDPSTAMARSGRGQRSQLRQTLLDWSGHVASWLDQRDIPLHLVRYEDLEGDPIFILLKAAQFAGIDVTADKAARAAHLSAFDALRRQEEASGFIETVKGRPFFRRGHSGAWRLALSPTQAKRIEDTHHIMMARLGYRL